LSIFRPADLDTGARQGDRVRDQKEEAPVATHSAGLFAAIAPRHYAMIEPEEPVLYRDQFPFTEIPRILFDGTYVRPQPPAEIWITDTTFRDGQQSRPPYTPQQIVDIYTLLHRLGGAKGIIRQSEFFIYSKRDRAAVEGCLALGYKYPEVTSWIRAHKDDLKLVREFGLAETGILASCSDYHIHLKLRLKRASAMAEYLAIVKEALSLGIRPRVHLEDITRADIYGFCLPLAEELLRLAQESGVPIKIRLCDTLGYGLTYPEAILPRSIPKMVHAFAYELGYPPQWLEWHGHNDFHKVHVNAATAWLYGCASLNASLLGFGERTGNPPLEAAVIEYIGLRGTDDGMNTRVITEIANYFREEVKAQIPSNYPFVGSEFNTTRAGIHADGIMKNEEIYNIFDTSAILNRPLRITVTDKSGLAGIAQWLNDNVPELTGIRFEPLSKRHPGVRHINTWVTEQYEQGRTSSISPDELIAQAHHYLPHLFISDFEKVKREAIAKAVAFAGRISASAAVQALDAERMERFLHDVVRKEASIQLIAVTNTEGRRISQVHTQRGEKALYRNLMNKDFRKHEWFVNALKTGEPYFSDLFFSKYTGRLILTAAVPIYEGKVKRTKKAAAASDAAMPAGPVHDGKTLRAIMDIDFVFDELAKLASPIPEEILASKEEKTAEAAVTA
jgi:citrate (Re)-synthase